MNSRPWTLSLCLASLFTVAMPAQGGDIDSDIVRGQFTGEGGYFEIGAHLFAGNSPIVGVPKDGNTVTGGALSLSGRWQQGAGFIEVESLGDINIGLNLWNNEHWWVDALVSQYHQGFDPQDVDALENSNLRERSRDLPIGLRATGYLGNTLIQITFLSGDLRDKHNGYSLAAELGQYWQIRNLNFHWLLGALFDSDTVAQYYFGIDSNQADANFPAYQADASLRLFSELGLTMALSEHWVLRGEARYAHLSSAIKDSPFIEDSYATLAALTLSYIF
jgi:outer membrane scaffolding protein for murein synthesis (MipA/OmpV family)